MQKGCIAILIILGVLVIGGAGGGYYVFNSYAKQYGLDMASAISHEILASDDTRVKAVVKTEYVRDYLLGLLPPELDQQLPAYIPWSVQDAISEALPYEFAILAGTEPALEAMDVTIFLNEKRGGPLIADFLNQQGIDKMINFVEWGEGGFELPERGMLTGGGAIPVPEMVQTRVSGIYAEKSGPSDLSITGNNLAEILIDNRDGDAAVIVGLIVDALGPEGMNGMQPQQVLNAQEFEVILRAIQDVYLAANITGPDEITIDLRIVTTEGTGLMERMMIMGGINDAAYKQIKALCAQNNLVFDFKPGKKPNWGIEGPGTLSGSFVLTGFRERIEQQIEMVTAQQQQ